MEIVHPRWASWSFLLYAGGFTMLGAALAALATLSNEHGDAAYALLSFLIFAVAAAVALVLRRRGGHPVAAGIAAVIAVLLFGAFVGSLYSWFGWLDSSRGSAFDGFDLARLTLALLILAAAFVALRLFRFPLVMLVVVAVGWFFVTDLLSGGGNWSAVVTFLVGLVFLALAASLDGRAAHPYAFWLHVGAGLTIGGSLLYFFHDGNLDWSLIVVGALLYVLLAERLRRSSWAVLAAVGILLAAGHFAGEVGLGLVPLGAIGLDFGSSSSALRGPVVFAIAGLVLMALGGLLARRQRVAA